MTPVILPLFPDQRAIREIIYLLVSNAVMGPAAPDIFIPYAMFADIMPGMDNKVNVWVYVSRVRPWLSQNGYYVRGYAGGYRCFKSIVSTDPAHGKDRAVMTEAIFREGVMTIVKSEVLERDEK
jgi:hypothetical protein